MFNKTDFCLKEKIAILIGYGLLQEIYWAKLRAWALDTHKL